MKIKLMIIPPMHWINKCPCITIISEKENPCLDDMDDLEELKCRVCTGDDDITCRNTGSLEPCDSETVKIKCNDNPSGDDQLQQHLADAFFKSLNWTNITL